METALIAWVARGSVPDWVCTVSAAALRVPSRSSSGTRVARSILAWGCLVRCWSMEGLSAPPRPASRNKARYRSFLAPNQFHREGGPDGWRMPDREQPLGAVPGFPDHASV